MSGVARSVCLNENEILSLFRGSLTGNQDDARGHIDECGTCQQLVACLLDESGSADASGSIRISSDFPWQSLAGQAIGRYRLREAIGAGAMGVVYLADDPQLSRTVAVKVHRGRDAAASDRLLREARALARLSHPNVIVVHEVGTFDGNVFMAMEFVDGGSLTSWLADRERSTEEILDVFVQAGRGLAVAHAAGLVHRDFKPDNVLVGRDGRVRVVDFGLAREELLASVEKSVHTIDPLARTQSGSTSLTRTGTVVGTPAYMAPEQYAGGRADARSDQFAFAVALFEGLYGQRPFLGDTFARLERAVSSGAVLIPRVTRRIPKLVTSALLRSLRTKPEARFESMDALLGELTGKARPTRTLMTAGALVAVACLGVIGARGLHGSNTAHAARPAITADLPSTAAATAPTATAAATPTGDVPAGAAVETAAEAPAPKQTSVVKSKAQPTTRAVPRPTAAGAAAPSAAKTDGRSNDLFDSIR